MQVAKLVSLQRMEVFEEPMPRPLPGQVLVRITVAGICGSDLHYFLEGGLGSFRAPLPLSMGHEPCGVVVDPNGSQALAEGDRIAIDPGLPCRACEYCDRGLFNLCRRGFFMGVNTRGAFQEYMAVDERQLLKLDDSASDEHGAMLEPFGVAYHAVRLAKAEVGASVTVFGAGAIGLSLVAAAKLAGAGEVFLVDKLAHRVQFGQRVYGAEHGVVEPEVDPVAYIHAATRGRGVDVAFDAAGMQKTIHDCFRCAASAAKIVLVGIPTFDLVSYNPHVARTKELTILNVRRSNHALHKCFDLCRSKRFSLGAMVTHRFPLEKVQVAFEIAASYSDGVIKAAIVAE